MGAIMSKAFYRYSTKIELVESFEEAKILMSDVKDLRTSIKSSICKSVIFKDDYKSNQRKDREKECEINIVEGRTIGTAYKEATANKDQRIGILNFASATNPGGGVAKGSSAQEESICRCTTLYGVLSDNKFKKEFYDYHKSRHDTLYTDTVIYSKDIVVFRNDVKVPVGILDKRKWVSVDVITCPAPNIKNRQEKPCDMRDVLLKRAALIFESALSNDVDILILGAWGCGAFGNSPNVVASTFKHLLGTEYNRYFDKVIFAIHGNGNYLAFKGIFDDTSDTRSQ
jgi:uncharacterized protein (TIGR02452 family)